MKRLFLVCLCLLLLCGCGTPVEPTAPATEQAPTATEAPTEPAGLYEPGSWLETATGGALKLYPLDSLDTQSVAAFGPDLLLLQTTDSTTLTKLSGANLAVSASVTLDCCIYLEDPAVQISEKGVTYYDADRSELVFLDVNLKEVNRVQAPEGILGTPALAQDRKTLYYLTDTALRVLDLESGIDRLLKEMHFYNQTLAGLHFDGSMIECSVSDEFSDWRQLYLNAATGELLYETLDYLTLYTGGGRYFATHMDGIYPEKLTGTMESTVRVLLSPDPNANAFPVLDRGGVVTSSQVDGTVVFDYYELYDGIRPYSLQLPVDCYPWCFTAVPDENCLWFLWYDEERSSDILTRWDLEKSRIADDTVYIGARRTLDDPDQYGLEDCAAYAAQLSQKYGVQILTWTDATAFQPWDYTLEAEHQVTVLAEALNTLDTALSHFPPGFFEKSTSEMGDGVLRIGLVRGIYGLEDAGTLETAAGLQYWDDDFNAHISLQVGNEMEQNLYHELFHVLESRILSRSQAFDTWDALNPAGFQYDYEYTSYNDRVDYSLLEDDTRAFIDFYAMTYPKEDRARIMEYAMMAGNAGYFSSEIMQAKLLAICTGIREAYGLESAAESFLWEQYLNEPIHAYG